MNDKETIIKGLEECMSEGKCSKCVYAEKQATLSCKELLSDIYTLLKEHEAVEPVRDELTGRFWLCGKCGSYVGFEDNDPYDPNEYDKYCRECGRPVLWKGWRS